MLQFNDAYNHPLQPGSLPSGLSFLQFGWQFNQPLPVGVLPASLLHLSLLCAYQQPLVKGSLPASLERLSLSELWSHPLEVGVLPPRLAALNMGGFDEPLHPHVLPSSLLHLGFGLFDQPLPLDVLPSSLVHLHLGSCYDHPLPPGVLPSSLRELTISNTFNHPLQVGALPESLPLPPLLFHRGPLRTAPPAAGSAAVDAAAPPCWATATTTHCLRASYPPLCSGSSCRAGTATGASRQCSQPMQSAVGSTKIWMIRSERQIQHVCARTRELYAKGRIQLASHQAPHSR